MVAVIRTGKSLRSVLNYNEQKVKQGKAVCLTAVNYPKDLEFMTFYQKLSRLTNQANLNQRSKVNSVHISLNFDPSEKLKPAKLQTIAREYMEKVGFGEQPYLVYQHHDSGHPHLHIVTTSIKPDGKRIELHNLGKTKSEKARQEIEKEYGLIKANSKSLKQQVMIIAVHGQKIQYGKSETKRAIINVLDKVINQYKYTSLEELNAILKQYNVIADRGSETSRTYRTNGLIYRVLDERGLAVGVGIKASSIYSKPIIKSLEQKFNVNEQERKPFKQHLKTAIDWTLHGKQTTLGDLIAALKSNRIDVVLRQNSVKLIYGITFIDHKNKCVFNGSDLGKEYSIAGIAQRCSSLELSLSTSQNIAPTIIHDKAINTQAVFLAPLNIDKSIDQIPAELKADQKKKKRKRVKL